MRRLAALGVDMDDVGLTLENQGVASFHESFRQVLAVLDGKASHLAAAWPAQRHVRVTTGLARAGSPAARFAVSGEGQARPGQLTAIHLDERPAPAAGGCGYSARGLTPIRRETRRLRGSAGSRTQDLDRSVASGRVAVEQAAHRRGHAPWSVDGARRRRGGGGDWGDVRRVVRAPPAGVAAGTGPGVSSYGPDARKLFVAQGVRAFGYGFAAVLLGTSLEERDVPAWQVGVVLGATVAGTALMSALVARYADRVGRRRWYGWLYALLGVVGVVFVFAGSVWVLTLAALTGVLSTEVIESGPFTSLEQPMLASDPRDRAQVHGLCLNATLPWPGRWRAWLLPFPTWSTPPSRLAGSWFGPVGGGRMVDGPPVER